MYIKKHNQSFGYGNRFRFIFGLKTSFEMSEGRLNVSLFFGRQIISYNKAVVLANLLSIEYYVSNLPFVTESSFKDRHPLINDAFSNCQQSLSISLV